MPWVIDAKFDLSGCARRHQWNVNAIALELHREGMELVSALAFAQFIVCKGMPERARVKPPWGYLDSGEGARIEYVRPGKFKRVMEG